MKLKSNDQDIFKCLWKRLLVMRITLTFILLSSVFAYSSNSYSQNTKLSLNLNHVTVSDVFRAIEEQSEFIFFYRDQQIDLNRKVDIIVEEKNVSEILDQLFKGSGNVYKIHDRQIIIGKTQKQLEAISLPVQRILEDAQQPQKKEFSGTVKDVKGLPLPGVSIVIKGTTNGIVTDVDGKFILSVPSDAKIITFSFVGMKTQEFVIGKNSTANITLAEEIVGVDEIVVVGYGSQKKVTLTGAVSSITGEELAKTRNENVQNSLAGKIAGVTVVQNSAEPGTFNTSFQIRGMGSALVVIDGVPRDNMNKLDANEIESISVLKDASAAIYGVRAANGVVLITTKKGSGKKMQLEYNGTVGYQESIGLPDIGSATDYMTLMNENNVNRGLPLLYSAADFDPYKNGTKKTTDWSGIAINKTAPQTQHNLSARGSSEKVDYFVNFGYLKQDGFWKSGDLNYNRFNLRSNVTAWITKRLSIEVLLNLMKDTRNKPYRSTESVYKSVWNQVPIWPVYANDNPDYLYNAADAGNTMAITNSDISGYSINNNKLFQGTFNLTYDVPFINGLKAKAMYSYDYNMSDNKSFSKEYTLYNYDATTDTYNGVKSQSPSSINRSFSGGESTLMQMSLNYARTFNQAHHVTALMLYEESTRSADNFYASRELTLDAVEQLFAGNSLNQEGSMDAGGLWKMSNKGYVGRLNYDYRSKYIAEFSSRYDGSSKFASTRQWGLFPAASLGWRLSEESFFKNSRALAFVNNMKLRASYGKMGDDNSSSYQFLSGYNYPAWGYVFNGQWVNSLGMRGMPNPDITWYTAETLNLGIDVDMWKGLLGVQFDVFNRKRDGLLATRNLSLPGTVGAGLPQENLEGDLTKGFEIALTHKLKIGSLNYFISGNVAYSRTQWQYKEIAKAGNSYLNYTNNSTGRYNDLLWGYGYVGPFNSYAQAYAAPIQDSKGNSILRPGDSRYVDWNGDGVIDGNDNHPIALSGYPKINFGFTFGADWHGFDLNMTFQGTAQSYVRYPEQLEQPLLWERNGLAMFMDRWHLSDITDPNSAWIPGHYPSTNTGESTNYDASEHLLQDASYIRLKSLEFGYTIPVKILKKTGVQKVRIYFTGYNLLTFTGIKYLDPEHPADSNGYLYPLSKTYNTGISLTF